MMLYYLKKILPIVFIKKMEDVRDWQAVINCLNLQWPRGSENRIRELSRVDCRPRE